MADIDIKGIDNVLNTLNKLPRDVASSSQGGMVNLSMRKGARLIQAKQKVMLQASIDKNGSESTGLLMKNLQIKRGRTNNGHKLVLTVRRKSYPKKEGQKKAATTRQTAQLMEYGSSHQPEQPWVRPAFVATASTSIATITDDLKKRVDKAAQKYLSEGK
ncbi:hypothetical protein W822_20015 [Advenella kashmirensis W13003]|uniref:HK97 gp10 family phage protein n=1 Tax=Advenella kashmirensis W13003 TaxID=1424334 RepID=V8QMY7_9BURK|nr:hypothetical protein [Advenella kashmirensis]ETF00683.1 hypothetical protein W822_20015 [Advenella kashmirensis W13003]